MIVENDPRKNIQNYTHSNKFQKKDRNQSSKNKNFIINKRAFSAFLLQRKPLKKNTLEEKKKNILLKEKIERTKEEINLKIKENLQLCTKLKSGEQEMKKMNELKNKIKDFLKSNNNDKKKVKNEMEIFFLKKDIYDLNKKIQILTKKISVIKNDTLKEKNNFYVF